MNEINIIGRLVKDIEPKQDENSTTIILAVNRHYKNEDGIYETDFIDIELRENLAKYVGMYCFKGDIIAVRGRLETYNTLSEDGTKTKRSKVVAEKVTFISSTRNTSISEEEA